MKKLLILTILMIGLTACGGGDTANNSAPANGATNKPANNSTAAKPTIDPNYQATFPFKDFPTVETAAKAGEVVLVPSYNWLQEANIEGVEKTTMIWYSQKMSAPGAEMSEVEFMSDKKKVPNAYIVPIPAGGKAKKGDIVLTWWQSGSGMQRAIVVDDANPAEPTVRYLDIEYDNPAKSRDGKTTIGQMDEQLKPNSFTVINAMLAPGTSVSVQDGDKMKHAIVIRVAGDKVFVREFAGKINVYDRARCTGVPVVPQVKEGDKVKGVWVGSFENGTVTKVDARNGRVFINFDVDKKEKAVAFGNVMK